MKKPVNINNRKARFDFEFIRTLTAGMQLMGSEVKSIKDNRVSFVDSYCYFKEKELFLKNLNITPISSHILMNLTGKEDCFLIRANLESYRMIWTEV